VNGDDIVFDDIRVREPVRRLRPDRDRRFAALAYELPAAIDLPIFLDRQAADAIERHALSDTSVELGGILLGKECLDDSTGLPFVAITHCLEAKHFANTQASFTYTHDSWEEITRERDRLYPDADIIGWYHTHPNFGIFLSHHDIFIHQHFFANPLQIAYVVDPINQSRGFFQWRDGNVVQVSGYFLYSDRNDRLALARLVNDLEKTSDSDTATTGSFSPRLEAELINMLKRPSASTAAASPLEKLQIASIFGLLGTIAGVLVVALALWLLQLQGRVQDQSETLDDIARNLEHMNESQRLISDNLLQSVPSQEKTTFAQQYAKTAKARDEALVQLSAQRAISESLGARTKELDTRATSLAAELEKAQKTVDKYEKDPVQIPAGSELFARWLSSNTDLQSSNESLQRKLDELAPLAVTEPAKLAADYKAQLIYTRFTAYLGSSLAVIFGLLLLADRYFRKPSS
jgi:proteasome lid subunit RPN8/RPN11